MIEYNSKTVVMITVKFNSTDDFLLFRKFRQKQDMVPLVFNPNEQVYGCIYSAGHKEKDSETILKWLAENGAKKNKQIFL